MPPDAETPTKKRRNPAQIERDENAIKEIAEIIQSTNRWSANSLRESHDRIGDLLVAAGRL